MGYFIVLHWYASQCRTGFIALHCNKFLSLTSAVPWFPCLSRGLPYFGFPACPEDYPTLVFPACPTLGFPACPEGCPTLVFLACPEGCPALPYPGFAVSCHTTHALPALLCCTTLCLVLDSSSCLVLPCIRERTEKSASVICALRCSSVASQTLCTSKHSLWALSATLCSA